MMTVFQNIYKTARKNTNLTQEDAAELLHISTRSLADYETGRTIPPDDIVCNMINIYRAPWLGYQHLKQSTEVGQKYLPDISFTDLARAVLRFQKEVRDLDNVDKDMIDIACDGQVDQAEEERWRRVAKEIDEMAAAAMAVLFSAEKEKSAC